MSEEQADVQFFIGGTLIDGAGGDPVPNATVVVKGKTIESVGVKEDISIPEGSRVMDVSGKTLMPGMFDCHAHLTVFTASLEKNLFTHPTYSIFRAAQVAKHTLRSGFTTVRDAGGLNAGFRQAVADGLVEGPRMLISGMMGQSGGHFDAYYPSGGEPIKGMFGEVLCDGLPEVRKSSRQILKLGFDFIKICTTGGVGSPADSPEFTEWTPEELAAIVYEAKARDREVLAHAEGTRGIKNAVRAGVWSIEHGSMLDDEAIDMMLETGTYLVPTLFVVEDTIVRGAEEIGLSELSFEKAKRLAEVHSSSFSKAAAAGVKIAVGTDKINDKMNLGRSAWELELMVRYGFTPMQAIVAATRTSAEVCRIADRVGTLEPGKLADMLVIDGDPLADITLLQDLSKILLVMKEGREVVNRMKSA